MVEEFGRGGIARYTVDVAALIGSAADVIVATTDEGPASGATAPAEVWFPRRRPGLLGKSWALVAGVNHLWARTGRGDVVWLPLGVRPMAELVLSLAARARGTCLVVTLHNRAPHRRGGVDPLVIASARLATRVVVHTAALAGWACRHHPRVTELPFPIPRHDQGPAVRWAREELGIPPGALVLVGLGTVAPYKGFDVLVRALAQVPAARASAPAMVAVLAGGSPDGPDLADLAHRAGVGGAVRHLPRWLSDAEVEGLLALADAAVLPYRHVDHSSAAALFSARGVPALASDVPTLRSAFGPAARYAPPGDAAALARLLETLPATLPELRAHAAARGAPPPAADDYQRFIGELPPGGRHRGSAAPGRTRR